MQMGVWVNKVTVKCCPAGDLGEGGSDDHRGDSITVVPMRRSQQRPWDNMAVVPMRRSQSSGQGECNERMRAVDTHGGGGGGVVGQGIAASLGWQWPGRTPGK